MKQEYETPKMEMIQFTEADVIMTSGGYVTGTTSWENTTFNYTTGSNYY